MANLKYIGKNILNHTLEIKKGDVSGSSSSTGSFGRGEVTTLEASSFGSSASTLISGSFTSTSSSLASRITTAETELGNTLISSSAQIASDISGSFTSTSSSLAGRLTTEEGNVDTLQARDLIAGTGLTGGGTLASDRTFNVVGGTGITANANDIEIDFSDSTLQTTISGSVTSVSSSLAGRITTEEGNVDTLQARDLIAGAGLTGGGTLASDRTFNVGAGTGVTVNANDVAIGQAVATSDNVTFGSVTTTGNISGSSTSTGSFGRFGINTGTPRAKMEILGDTSTYDGMAKIFLMDSNGNSNSRNFSIGNGGTAFGSLNFVVSNAKDGIPVTSGTGTSIMTLNGVNKYVGIDNITPTAKLHIKGGSYNTSLKIQGSAGNSGIVFLDSSSNIDGYVYADADSIGLLDSGGDWTIQTKGDDFIRFATNNNTERLIITSTNKISGSSDSTGSFGRVESDTFNATTFTSTEVTSTNLTVTGTITGSSLDVSGDGIFGGNITTLGDVIAKNYIVSSSVTHMTQSFSSGSTIFGDSADDTHLFVGSKISGSSNLTGSFGAVSIGKGTADNQRALTISGNVQLDNNNAIYFKRSTGTADPHIIYNSNNDFNIFNPLAGEIKFAVGSAEIVVVDSSGLTFNGSKTIGSSAGAGVITIAGNSGLKLKSGGGGGSGPIELIQGSTTYWSVGTSGALTGSADLVMNAGKNISGSATSTGSFGEVHTEGVKGLAGDYSSVLLVPDTLQFGNDADSMFRRRTSNDVEFRMAGSDIVRINTSGLQVENGNLEVESGNVIASGNISGSSTSTGSFGDIKVGDNTVQTNRSIMFGGVEGFKVGYAQSGFLASTGAASDGADAEIVMTGTGGSAPFDQHGSIVYKTRAVDTLSRSSHIFYTGRTSAERVRIDHDGNLGIGTAAPYYKAHISFDNSTTAFSGGSSGNWGGNGLRIENTNSTTDTKATLQLRANDYDALISAVKKSGGNTGEVHFNVDPDANTNQLLTLAGSKISGSSTSTGSFGAGYIDNKLGVGISAPTHTLHALSTDNKAFLLDRNTGNNPTSLNEFSSYYSLSIKNRASGTYLNFGGSSTHTSLQATDGAGSATAKNLLLNPYGGNVGIATGNTAPTEKLHVAGNIFATSNISGSSTSTGSFGAVSTVTSLFTNRIANSVGQGAFTLDSADDIILDAGGGDVLLYDDGSEFARLTNDSNTLAIKSSTSNADIVLNGVDSGANITALRLDMSEKGKAIFNSDVSGSSTSTGSFGHLHVAAQGSTYLATLGNDGLSVKGSSNSTGTNFRVRDGSGNTRFNVHGYGQTGIGTDSAQTMLHIVQTSAGLQNSIGEYIRLEDSSNYSASFGLGANGTLKLIGNTVTVASEGSGVGNLTVDGKVHIGAATTPTNHLEVEGTIYASGNISGSSTSTGSFGSLVVADKVQGNINFGGTSNIFRTTTADQYTTVRIDQGTAQYGGKLHFGGLLAGNADYVIGEIGGIWNYDTSVSPVAAIRFETGDDTTNRDDGRITFWTSAASRTLTERMRIQPSGVVKIGTDSISKYEFDNSTGGATPFHYIGRNTSNATYPIATFNHSGGTSLWVGTTKISGSATSTGSFGALQVPGNVSIGTESTSHDFPLVVQGADNSTLIRIGGASNSDGGQESEIFVGNAANSKWHNLKINAYNTRFTVAGTETLKISANSISGSSTSTGSFGAGYIDNKLGIGTTSPADSIDIQQTDSVIRFKNTGASNWQGIELYNPSDSSFVAGYGSYANTTNGYIRDAGGSVAIFNSSGWGFYGRNIKIQNTGASDVGFFYAPNTKKLGLGGEHTPAHTLHISGSGNTDIFVEGNVSGSSTSTGSFGVGFFDDSVGMGVAPGNSSYLLNIEAAQTYAARFKSRKTTSSTSQRTMILVGSGQDKGAGIFFQGPGTNLSIGVKEDNKFHIAPGRNDIGDSSAYSVTVDTSGNFEVTAGNISGSATSTGSFGRVEVNSISASLYQGQIGSRYVHSQTSDSATWSINHNIGHKYPVVTVYDTSDQMILPETGTATDSDTFTLTFNEAIQGKAVVSVGGIGENAGGNYIFTQDSSTTNWRVTHSLSQQYPNVTVYDGSNQVIIPESITAASSNEMDITFSDAQSGYANFSIGSGIPNISAENAGKVLKVRSGGQGVEWSPTSNDVSGSMSVSGSITPTIDNFHNLGSATHRWANLHTGDIQLSNEGSEGNEVDGTTGSWTIQEGEDDLYLLNRKNGKKYKFKLEEIT